MTIKFFSIEDDTMICQLAGATSNPFSVGKVVNLTVDMIDFDKIKNSHPGYISVLQIENKRLSDKYNDTKVKLISEDIHIDIESGTLTIEYYCEVVS